MENYNFIFTTVILNLKFRDSKTFWLVFHTCIQARDPNPQTTELWPAHTTLLLFLSMKPDSKLWNTQKSFCLVGDPAATPSPHSSWGSAVRGWVWGTKHCSENRSTAGQQGGVSVLCLPMPYRGLLNVI